MARKPENFGKRIYGSRADIARKKTITADDVKKMTPQEQAKFLKRDKMWPKENPDELISSGVSKEAAFFRDFMRKAVYASPRRYMKGEYNLARYAQSVKLVKEKIEKISTYEDIVDFYKDNDFFIRTGHLLSISPTYGYAIDERKAWTFYGKTEMFIRAEMRKAHFMETEKDMLKVFVKEDGKVFLSSIYASRALAVKNDDHTLSLFYIKSSVRNTSTAEAFLVDTKKGDVIFAGKKESCEKEAEKALEERKAEKEAEKEAKRKGNYIPPQLKVIERTGSDYESPRIMTGPKFMRTYGLKGGQYGNWMTASDRRKSLAMAYDAMEDLATALDAEPSSLGLGSTLGIAFGARGRGGSAMAHYEPGYKVINLTKTHGAGSLAHEYGHALDNYIRDSISGTVSSVFASQDRNILPEMNTLVKAMLYKEGNDRADFFTNARRMDAERGSLYFSKREEMFARAFACYVKDKLEEKGIRSDYLVGHADAFSITAPHGEERKRIDESFDCLIAALKERGILKAKEEKKEAKEACLHSFEFETEEDENGQMCFVF